MASDEISKLMELSLPYRPVSVSHLQFLLQFSPNQLHFTYLICFVLCCNTMQKAHPEDSESILEPEAISVEVNFLRLRNFAVLS